MFEAVNSAGWYKSCGGFSKVIMKRSRLITGTALPNGIAKCLIKVGEMGGFSFNKLRASKEACSFALWMNDLAHVFSLFCVLLVFLSASLRINQLYWPSGQLCFRGSAHSTHPSRYKAFLVPENPCACFLLTYPLLQTASPTRLILPWLFYSLHKRPAFFSLKA